MWETYRNNCWPIGSKETRPQYHSKNQNSANNLNEFRKDSSPEPSETTQDSTEPCYTETSDLQNCDIVSGCYFKQLSL